MKPLLVILFCLLSSIPQLLYAELRVVDNLGNVVELKKPAQRVIALAPHLTETLFAAGAGDTLVATVAYSDYPEAAQAVPRVGSYTKANIEAILSYQPDLILSFKSGNGLEFIKRLKSFGVPVYVSEPKTLPDIAQAIRAFGVLTGNKQVAENAAQQFMQRLQGLQNNYGQREKVRVFYQVWHEPLGSLNDEHVISDVIRLCGGENVFGDSATLVPKLNVESVFKVDPDVIIASGMGEARPDWLDNWLQWPSLKAVKNRQLYFIPPDILQRHAPRILDGAEMLCQQLERVRIQQRK